MNKLRETPPLTQPDQGGDNNTQTLNRILRSKTFSGSNASRQILKFIVEKSLAGFADEIKEYTIATQALGRPENFDPREDNIVRVQVQRLRKKLEDYYREEGMNDPQRISIPLGHYHAEFHSPGHESETPARPETAASVRRLSGAARWSVWGIAAALVCALVLAAGIGISNRQKSELILFWNPILESEKPVLIYYPIFTAYLLSQSYWKRALPTLQPRDLEQPGSTAETPLLGEDQVLTGKDLAAVPDGFTTPGDLSATVNVVTLLDSKHRSYVLRSDANLAYKDLQGTPTVLIGAYSNYWTMNLTRNLHFFFDRGGRIRERGGQGRFWSNPNGLDCAATEDYAIVSRLLDSKTGGPVVVIAGTRTCGTEGAGKFITDPLQLKRQLGNIPRDALGHKNLELVLHISLVNCNPTSVDVVSAQYW